MKIFESEVSSGNASGKAGISSLPNNPSRGGYMVSGGNNGMPGITFTPSGEQRSNSYSDYVDKKDSKKHSINTLKKIEELKKKKMKKFKQFIKEDANATMGNSNGMGAVVAAQPGSSPGEQGTIGSGDIGQPLGAYSKSAPNLRKRKDGKYKMKKLTSYDNFNNSK